MPLSLDMRPSPSVMHRGYGMIGGLPAASQGEADGLARKLNVPSVVRIAVVDRETLTWIAGTRSSADGHWEVPCLALGRPYLVLGFDPLGQVNCAVQDWVYAAPMEP